MLIFFYLQERQIAQARPGRPLIVVSLHVEDLAWAEEFLPACFPDNQYELWYSASSVFAHNSPPGSQSMVESTTTTTNRFSVSSTALSDRSHFLQTFREKADEAQACLFVLSPHFARSDSCREQAFYCKSIKRNFFLRASEQFNLPGWLSMVLGVQPLHLTQEEASMQALCQRLQRAVSPHVSAMLEDDADATIRPAVNFLRQHLPSEGDHCLYVTGSLKNDVRLREICRCVGERLSRIDGLTLVTGGFFGVGREVSDTFNQHRRARTFYTGDNGRPTSLMRSKSKTLRATDAAEQSATTTTSDEAAGGGGGGSDCYHVLPEAESAFDWRAKQDANRRYEPISFGTSVIVGRNVREREAIVGRVLHYCLLIEGDATAACEAANFVWNGGIVLPIQSTGGAAGGLFDVPDQILQRPAAVSVDDWTVLLDERASAVLIAESVARCVLALMPRLCVDGGIEGDSTPRPCVPRPGAVKRRLPGSATSSVSAASSTSSSGRKLMKRPNLGRATTIDPSLS